jgi:hypothetical protein
MGTLQLEDNGTNDTTVGGEMLVGATKRPLKTSIGLATTTMTSLFDQTQPLSGKHLLNP